MTRLLLSFLLFSAFSPLLSAQENLQSPPEVTFKSFITGLQDPVRLVPSPDGRLFILEQSQGDVEIYQTDGTYLGKFLDVTGQISTGSERGLLGIAFHPNYADNGKFYLNYTNSSGDTVISEWTVSADPDVADASSEVILLTIDQDYSNHNGGHIAFGPDGMLYIGMGDGGSAGDPNGRAQDGSSLLGKMLRIRVAGNGTYQVPGTNPFVGDASVEDEIWAIGLRNPWSFSFDSETGDMWIGDVGQDSFEEIDFQPASSTGGENYGWRCWEGDDVYNNSVCSSIPHTGPVITHAHSGFTGWCSITGGVVYRGADYPGMTGYYLYSDYCFGEIHALKEDGDGGFTPYTVNGTGHFGYVHFAQGIDGTAYIVDISGEVLKVQDACNTLPQITLATGQLQTSITDATEYAWYLDGSQLVGETGSSITPTATGTYSCLVDVNGCVRLSNALEVMVTVGIPGCTYVSADNYNPDATVDDGTCTFDSICDGTCPEDLSGDGSIGAPDILALLGAFGTVCGE